MQIRATAVERIDPAYIFQRDHKKCLLCHGPLAMDEVVPHPFAPTLDHVVPLSQGGEHTRANLQAAHFICNSRKSDRGHDQQLALIG